MFVEASCNFILQRILFRVFCKVRNHVLLLFCNRSGTPSAAGRTGERNSSIRKRTSCSCATAASGSMRIPFICTRIYSIYSLRTAKAVITTVHMDGKSFPHSSGRGLSADVTGILSTERSGQRRKSTAAKSTAGI